MRAAWSLHVCPEYWRSWSGPCRTCEALVSRSRSPLTRSRFKNAAVLAVAIALASLGVYNIVLKATWTLMDDGVLWKDLPEGVVATRVQPGGPAALAEIHEGDILLEMDGQQVLTAQQAQAHLA